MIKLISTTNTCFNLFKIDSCKLNFKAAISTEVGPNFIKKCSNQNNIYIARHGDISAIANQAWEYINDEKQHLIGCQNHRL